MSFPNPNIAFSGSTENQVPGSLMKPSDRLTDLQVSQIQLSMYFRWAPSIWRPGTVSVIMILIGLFQTSVGYVGTSDSTIFYFGDNYYGQNGQENSSETARILDVDVSLLRSISCGGQTTVYLFDNNTLISDGQVNFGTSNPEISSVSSISTAIMYSLASNASIYGYGSNDYTVLLNDSASFISPPATSPPRLNEDVRYCTVPACLAFDNFPPGSITDEPVIHEPNVPLYKFIGAWGDLSYGHLGMYPLPSQSSVGTFYEGPDLIVKKVSISRYSSIFILHNNTVLVAGNGGFTPPTNGSQYLYLPIVYNSSIDTSEVKIVDASASPYHALLLSGDHRVFFFGNQDGFVSGIPGLGDVGTVIQTSEVPFAGLLSPDDSIVQISAHYLSSSVITKMGNVYTWGTQQANVVQYLPTPKNSFLRGRYAIRYLNQEFITNTGRDAFASCILTRPRAGDCTGEPPTADYYCVGGLWTTRGGGNSLDTITISSPTEIDGNLTISGPLVINPQSSISVTECPSVGSIEIVKPQGDDSPSQDIISTGKHCPDISATTVSVISTGNVKKCEKKTATLSKSETGARTVYSAIFNVNDNDCKRSNLWWIILVSVLGGVILIVIIAVLVALPIWRRKHSSAHRKQLRTRMDFTSN